MCASRNGRRRTRCGSGPTARPRWCSSPRLAQETKLERALVIAFALAEVLVEGGERVGIPGLMRPTASRNVIERMAQAILHDTTARPSLPPSFSPSPLAEVVLLSDFWSPIAEVHQTLAQLSASARARPRRADRRPGRGDLPVCRADRVRRAGGRRRHHGRPRRDLARRLSRRASSAIAPRSAPRPTGSPGASSSTAPTGRRASSCSRCTRGSAAPRAASRSTAGAART